MNAVGLSQPLRLLALVEATTLTGPARNLFAFARRAQQDASIDLSVIAFSRTEAGEKRGRLNEFISVALDNRIHLDIVEERHRFDTRVLSSVRKIVRRRNPDIIQTHSVKSHFLIKLLGEWRLRPWVAFHHGYTRPDLKMRFYNRLDRLSLPTADRVVTMNKLFALELIRAGVSPARIRLVQNAVERDEVNRGLSADAGQQLRRILGIEPWEKVVLAVGRLSREKGHADLLKSLVHLRQSASNSQVRLVLVGDGPERPRLEKNAARAGFLDRIIFTGQVAVVAPYYSMADVVVLPSHSEGSPNVLLEAMSAGAPVIAAAVGGVTDILSRERSGLLVTPHNHKALAAAIDRMLTEPGLASSCAARARLTVEQQYSHDARFRTLMTVYDELAWTDKLSRSWVA